VIERVIDEMAVGINHMILPQGTGLPVHNANAPVTWLSPGARSRSSWTTRKPILITRAT
jgi:hypothetical protein